MAKLIDIPKFNDSRGTISVIEKKIKFKIKRVYFIYDVKGIRGGHKHKKTWQFLICLNLTIKQTIHALVYIYFLLDLYFL